MNNITINTSQKKIVHMLFEICYIDKQGDVESLKQTVCGEESKSMIHVMKYRSKKTFIRDVTGKGSNYFEECIILMTQNSYQIDLYKDNLYANINQIQFGRTLNINFPFVTIEHNRDDLSFDLKQYFSI